MNIEKDFKGLVMNQNEQSAQTLRDWLKDQQDMQEKAVQRRERLLRIKDAGAAVGPWIDNAINHVQDEIDHLSGSMDLTRRLIGLAGADQLHDPSRG